MPTSQRHRIASSSIAAGACTFIVSCFATIASAQMSENPTTRPLLAELNHETRSLFSQVAPSIVRVQLPLPTSFSQAENDPLSKWATRLDPDSLSRLAEMQRRYPGASFATAEIRPATTEPGAPQVAVVPPTTQPSTPQHLIVLRLDRFSPNGIGIVLDDNHLLIPRYVDKAACTFPIPVAIGDGRWASATFVASDAPSDLTVLKLNPYIKGTPAMLAAEKPAAGTLLLVMSLNAAANRLAVWEGWEPDNAAIVNIDGSIAGFTRAGHFLSAAACTPVVSDLIHHGVVHRPFLGVVIEPVPADDPDRQANPTLGSAAALRILQVLPGTTAEHAGLAQNDIIISVAGESVGDTANFAAIITGRRGVTSLGIIRNGQTHVINVDLQVR